MDPYNYIHLMGVMRRENMREGRKGGEGKGGGAGEGE